MPLPSWPEGVPYSPQRDSVQAISSPQLAADKNGDGRRKRPPALARLAMTLGRLPQVIRMTNDQYETFKTWGKGTLSNWTGRFYANVWLGNAFGNKVRQFPEGAPKPAHRRR